MLAVHEHNRIFKHRIGCLVTFHCVQSVWKSKDKVAIVFSEPQWGRSAVTGHTNHESKRIDDFPALRSKCFEPSFEPRRGTF